VNIDTYSIQTHRRRVSCAAVDCDAWRNGWVTTVDPTYRHPRHGWTGNDQAAYVRAAGRRFTETTRRDGVIEFTFQPGQTCFAVHESGADREPLYTRTRRDDRRVYDRADQWVDDFATNQDRLAVIIEKG
jgi:hypothetical protein